MTAVACVDVGGTGIKSGVLQDVRLLEPRDTPTPIARSAGAEAIITAVCDLVTDLATRHDLGAVGLVVPGVVDAERGIGVWSENLRWRDARIRDEVAERTGLPVALGHDVRAGALAEARVGAGLGYRDSLFVAVGTGIAAGLVLDGVLHERNRPIGEIGHVDVGHGEPCVCGRDGCLEAVASAASVARRYAARTGETRTAKEVAELVTAGDPGATAVWHEAVDGLAVALTWVAGVLAPDVVIVGGGLARSGELLLGPVRAALKERLTFQHVPDIVPAALGERAGCLGAGLLALDLIGQQ